VAGAVRGVEEVAVSAVHAEVVRDAAEVAWVALRAVARTAHALAAHRCVARMAESRRDEVAVCADAAAVVQRGRHVRLLCTAHTPVRHHRAAATARIALLAELLGVHEVALAAGVAAAVRG